MKKIFISLLLSAIFGAFSVINAANEPTVEVFNKYSQPIWIMIKVGEPGTVQEKVPVRGLELHPGDSKAHIDIGTDELVTLYIDLDPIKKSSRPENYHDFKYIFKQPSSNGKTKYVTFNPEKNIKDPWKYLYPQTGTFMGFSGKTQSGHSLKKNIVASDINTVAAKQLQK